MSVFSYVGTGLERTDVLLIDVIVGSALVIQRIAIWRGAKVSLKKRE